jgi:signal peptidase II
MAKGKKYLVFLLIIVLGVALDQITKVVATANLYATCNDESPNWDPSNCPYDPHALFTWTHIYNDGAFLSLGATWSPTMRLIVLTILPGLLLIGVMVFMLRSDKVRSLDVVIFALIAAGGLGNIIDRILAGKVVDFMFMNFGFAHTGIFNVADLYIVVGVGLFILAAIFSRTKKTEAGSSTPSPEPTPEP